jgi:archaeosine-15-forming tRNA-guanine transglycosylase
MNADNVEFTPLMSRGNVTAITGDTITIKTIRKGDVTLTLSASTAVTIKKENEADKAGTLADIKAGETVSAGCQSVENGAAQVLWIDITGGM